MKLRNKKSGKIIIMENMVLPEPDQKNYRSLADLNEEWEDYEESKPYWYVDYGGRAKFINDANDGEDIARKKIGNHFKTKEEAEKAVEKLKAWKRLKERGFAFKKWRFTPDLKREKGNFIKIEAEIPFISSLMKDLDLLFGGEDA